MAVAKEIDNLEALLAEFRRGASQFELEIAPHLSGDAVQWSVADRRIGMKYLIDCVRGGMEPKRWAQLHPQAWARLVEIAPKLEPPDE